MSDTKDNTNTKQTVNCHNEIFIANVIEGGKIEWIEKRHGQSPSPYTHCSYCGSLHFEDVRTIIKEGGRLGSADWKYGYPHKFYAYPKAGGMEKFYTEHLKDLEEPAFAAFAVLLKQHTGIEFLHDEEGRIMYRAPYYGYQR
jgi:hypothetical protein